MVLLLWQRSCTLLGFFCLLAFPYNDKGHEHNFPSTCHWIIVFFGLTSLKTVMKQKLREHIYCSVKIFDTCLLSTETWTKYFRIEKEAVEEGPWSTFKQSKVSSQNYDRSHHRISYFKELFFTLFELSGFTEIMFSKFSQQWQGREIFLKMKAVTHKCSKRAKEQRIKYHKAWNKVATFGNAEEEKHYFHNSSHKKI